MQSEKYIHSISCVSCVGSPVLLPGVLGPWGSMIAAMQTRVIGFEAMQALPLRGWNGSAVRLTRRIFGDRVISSIEAKAWGYGTWEEVQMRKEGKKPGWIDPREEYPLPHDFLLFGSSLERIQLSVAALRQNFPRAVVIEHKAGDDENTAIELNPELAVQLAWQNPDGYDLHNSLVVIDHRHLVREGYQGALPLAGDEGPIAFIDESVDPNKIAAVHINPVTIDELRLFVRGQGEFYQFHAALAEKLAESERMDIPIVMEVPPYWSYYSELPEALNVVEDLFSNAG